MTDEKKTRPKQKNTEPARLTPEETEAFLKDFIEAVSDPEQANTMFSVLMLLIDFVKKGCGPYVAAELVKEYQKRTGSAGNLAEVADFAAALTREERQAIADRGIAAYKQHKEDVLHGIDTKPDRLPVLRYKGGRNFIMSTDKFTTTFFGIGAPTKRNLARGLMKGQITFEQLREDGNAVKYERDGEPELSVFYDFLPDEKTLEKYGIPEDFTDFDFFVMTIIDNLYAEGNDIVTVSKVCKEIGLTDKGGKQIKKVMLSLMKGLSTTVTINITDLKKEWGINVSGEKESLIVSPAIPVMIDADQYNVNGRYADGCIKINDFSPFYRISAAIRGGRFSTWPKEILQL